MNRPDCLIVGAGITGIFAALALSDQGLHVEIVDSKTLSSLPHEAEGEMLAFRTWCFDPLDTVRQESLNTCRSFLEGQSKVGALQSVHELHVVTRSEDVPQAKSLCERLRNQGSSVEFILQNDIGKFDSAISSEVFGAVLHHDVPLVESRVLHQSLREACAQKEIVIQWDTAAFGIHVENGRAVALRTSRGILPAGAILLTAGAGTMGIISAAGFQLPIVPDKRHTLVALPAGKGIHGAITEYKEGESGRYKGIRGDSEAALWVFFRDERETLVRDGRLFASSPDYARRRALEDLRSRFTAILPGYGHLLTDRVITHVHSCIVDGLPIIGASSTIDNLYLGLHHSDCRDVLAPAVGALAARAVTTEKGSKTHPFSMERFPQSAPGGQKRVKD